MSADPGVAVERAGGEAPHAYPRRVLAVASGMTPQVVTETIHALAVGSDPPFVPTEVRIITTSEGADRAREALLDPATGQFHRLCHGYGLAGRIHFDEACIRVLAGAAGPLQDIRTPAENVLAANAVTAFVRELCADAQAAVHVSIAGGRKSMSYYLGYALSLFGRPQDRLSHVLVNPPFETHREFFFPPPEPRVLVDAAGRAVSTADARVELADIPFVRLREGLPWALLRGDVPFGEAVAAAAQRVSSIASLDFASVSGAVVTGGRAVALPPLLWAWYALLARAAVRGWGDRGFVRYADIEPSKLLDLYGSAVGRMSNEFIQLEAQLRREGGIGEEFFRQKTSKLRRSLKEALGIEAATYLPHSRGRRPLTRYGLLVPPARIDGLD